MMVPSRAPWGLVLTAWLLLLGLGCLFPALPVQGSTCRMQQTAEHQFCGLPYELSNFQGHFKCAKGVAVGRPKDYQQLAQLVKAYDQVKASGVGHSWWSQMFCAGTNSSAINILTTEFSSTMPAMKGRPSIAIKVHENNMTVSAAAGVTQRTLLDYLADFRTSKAPDGYTLGAFTWFIDQTVAGAIATASHGSSFIHGSLSSQVAAITFMDAEGQIRTVTPASDPHLFKALQVSVGRLGIILEVAFRIVPNKAVRRDKSNINFSTFKAGVQQLQQLYVAARATGNSSSTSTRVAVWNVLKPWNEKQLFWFVPSDLLWNVSYTKLEPGEEDLNPPPVEATDGPGDAGMLPGAFSQLTMPTVKGAMGMDQNPKSWAQMYQLWLSINVDPATLPARRSYVSIAEFENQLHATWNAYDQYEVAIPLSKAGDCMAAVGAEVYGPQQLWQGFRAPGLIRFVSAESGYLSPSQGTPVIYINLEDHVSYTTGRPNREFQRVMEIFRSPVCGPVRLHWGKAGWPQHAKCFDGAKEYEATWCSFGCAVHQLDPKGKFAGQLGRDVWQWRATNARSGAAVDFASCCTPAGFDSTKCKCMSRESCAT